MRTLTIGSDYIEFKPAYVTDVKQIGIFIAVIFTCVTLLALSDFGVHWGPFVALCVVCLALSLTSYDATCRIGNGNMVLERQWLRKRFLRDIRLNDFVSIKVEMNMSRGSHRRVSYYPVLWSKENSVFSRLNYSFIGSVSSAEFESIDDFMRMLKTMSDITHLPVSFSRSCPESLLAIYEKA